jgi:UDP-N-acetylglucosamine/UDP-N-acetylgalactosamine diphosphorylase
MTIPQPLLAQLKQFGQDHVLRWWDRLNSDQQRGLVEQLQALDLARLQRLYEDRGRSFPLPDPHHIQPVPVLPRRSPDNARYRKVGEAALAAGQVAALVVAGGQGSRLGAVQPKGMFPVGPVSQKTLFQLHCEKFQALRQRYRADLPLLVMTSTATDVDTRQFFRDNRFFGLPEEAVIFFRQGTMPALALASGKLLLESPGRLFLSPDGHGGTLTALAGSGLLDRLRRRGVRHLYYFQVDNPLVEVADPVFIGAHTEQHSEASSKVVAKLGPTEKMGVFAQVEDRCTIIEYSDLPAELAQQTDAKGRLRFWAGSPAIHLFDLDFLARMADLSDSLPFHLARKKVPCLDETGQTIQPASENALKFEKFIFDLLPQAQRWLVVETTRAEEFAPLKNSTGPDSPETVTQAISDLAAAWLTAAGCEVPRTQDGSLSYPLEISPLFAMDAEQLTSKLRPPIKITGPTYLH